MGSAWPKISGRTGHQCHRSSCQKTRLNDLSYKNRDVLSKSTHLTDGQTDRHLSIFLGKSRPAHSQWILVKDASETDTAWYTSSVFTVLCWCLGYGNRSMLPHWPMPAEDFSFRWRWWCFSLWGYLIITLLNSLSLCDKNYELYVNNLGKCICSPII